MKPGFTNRQKVVHVTIWTVVLTVLTTAWVMTPAIGDNEALEHIVWPYWMIAYHWYGRGAAWIMVPVVLQYPVYGWLVARAWKEDRFLAGLAVVTSAHVGAMLLSVLMTTK